VVFSRVLPVIRHLIGIPAGMLKIDFRWYSLATLIGSLVWCCVLAGLGVEVGRNRELLLGSVHRFSLLVIGIAVVLAALYYLAVVRPARGARLK
jgi:membrane protein DedA with SNARE-associated domain